MSLPVRVVDDIGGLPTHGFGPKGLGWWGVMGFMLIEGMAFVLAIGGYFYLMEYEQRWPPTAPPPDLAWGTLFTALAVLSLLPNLWLDRRAHAQDLPAVRRGLVVMTALGVLLMAIRAAEIAALNELWYENAYASITWALLLLHTLHTATDLYDTGVLAALIHAKPVDGRKFSDVADNSLYWHFIVWSWVLIYLVLYWVPRWA
jgi:heme/copper-type cytochrome/quinol oxidase subunit 3